MHDGKLSFSGAVALFAVICSENTTRAPAAFRAIKRGPAGTAARVFGKYNKYDAIYRRPRGVIEIIDRTRCPRI